MAWTDDTSMPWMQPPIKSYAPENLGANFVQGFKASLDAAEQRATLPLKMQAMTDQAKARSLDLAAQQKAMDYDAQTKQGQAELADVFTKAASVPDGWANPQVYGWMGEVGKKYPAIVGTQAWQHGVDNVTKANTLAETQRYHKELVQQRAQAAQLKADTAVGVAKAKNPFGMQVGQATPIYNQETGEDTGLIGVYSGSAMHFYPNKKAQDMSVGDTVKVAEALRKIEEKLNDPNLAADSYARLKGQANRLNKIISGVPKKTVDEAKTAISDGALSGGGYEPKETPSSQGYQPAVIGDMPNVISKDEYDQLPPGTRFIQDGKQFTKP